MKISAKVENSYQQHLVRVRTDDKQQILSIAGKPTGHGSAVNGGEFLLLAIATCFCNDIYREAQQKNIKITKVTVEASAEFAAPGAPGHHFTYKAKVEGEASEEEIAELIKHTDTVTEIQNTLRQGVEVTLTPY